MKSAKQGKNKSEARAGAEGCWHEDDLIPLKEAARILKVSEKSIRTARMGLVFTLLRHGSGANAPIMLLRREINDYLNARLAEGMALRQKIHGN